MENTINQRVARVINDLGLNPKTFAERIGKTPTSIYTILNGRNKPGYDILEAILQVFPEVSPNYLMKGEGEPMKIEDKTLDGRSFGSEVAGRILEEFRGLKDQLSIKDRQIDGLQRTIDVLLSGRQAPEKSFPKPVSRTGRVFEMYPRNEAKRA
ncbi:helix-turn-helix domain-containing protein [Spirosoma horti]